MLLSSQKPVYEAHGLRESGEVFAIEVIECDGDETALSLAEDYAKRWQASVIVYRVPFINISSQASSDLWPDQMVRVGKV